MTKLQHLRPLFLRNPKQQCYRYRLMSKTSSSDEGSNGNSSQQTDEKKISRPMYVPDTPVAIEDIDEPTNCCMSGCANCVWIEYAEKLSAALKDSPSEVQKLIVDKVQDPNMRAFLSMELRIRKIIE